jgi:hypothetical protein
LLVFRGAGVDLFEKFQTAAANAFGVVLVHAVTTSLN